MNPDAGRRAAESLLAEKTPPDVLMYSGEMCPLYTSAASTCSSV
jgi:hypothetical protein